MDDGGKEVEESRPVGCEGNGFGTELAHGLSGSGMSIQVPHAGLHAQLTQLFFFPSLSKASLMQSSEKPAIITVEK